MKGGRENPCRFLLTKNYSHTIMKAMSEASLKIAKPMLKEVNYEE